MRKLSAILAFALASPVFADDAGADAGVSIFAKCVEPPAGDEPIELDGGAILLSPARARYDACRIGAGSKCGEFLDVDAGAPPSSVGASDVIEMIGTIAAAILAGVEACRAVGACKH